MPCAIDFSRGFWYGTLPCPFMFKSTRLLTASTSAVENGTSPMPMSRSCPTLFYGPAQHEPGIEQIERKSAKTRGKKAQRQKQFRMGGTCIPFSIHSTSYIRNYVCGCGMEQIYVGHQIVLVLEL